jgi:hypothetical protein
MRDRAGLLLFLLLTLGFLLFLLLAHGPWGAGPPPAHGTDAGDGQVVRAVRRPARCSDGRRSWTTHPRSTQVVDLL